MHTHSFRVMQLENPILVLYMLHHQLVLRLVPRPGEFKHIKLYVGCALTGAPREYVEMIEKVKDRLRSYVEILDFLGLGGGEELSEDVYRRDIHECVGTCGLFVPFCDIPSIGLGYEMGTMIEKHKKPTLILAHIQTKLTRLVTGAAMANENARLFRYSDAEEVFWVIIDALRHWRPHVVEEVETSRSPATETQLEIAWRSSASVPTALAA